MKLSYLPSFGKNKRICTIIREYLGNGCIWNWNIKQNHTIIHWRLQWVFGEKQFDIPTHPLKFKDITITLSGYSKLKMYLVLFHLVNILLELNQLKRKSWLHSIHSSSILGISKFGKLNHFFLKTNLCWNQTEVFNKLIDFLNKKFLSKVTCYWSWINVKQLRKNNFVCYEFCLFK